MQPDADRGEALQTPIELLRHLINREAFWHGPMGRVNGEDLSCLLHRIAHRCDVLETNKALSYDAQKLAMKADRARDLLRSSDWREDLRALLKKHEGVSDHGFTVDNHR